MRTKWRQSIEKYCINSGRNLYSLQEPAHLGGPVEPLLLRARRIAPRSLLPSGYETSNMITAD